MQKSSLDAFFNLLVEENDFSGAVLAADEGHILLHQGYGFANDADHIKVTAETVFDIGSLAKQFTATAILQLEAQGLLKVTDAITKYFVDIPTDKAAITIHQLLTHSAGFVEEHSKGDLESLDRKEALQAILNQKPGFTPGSNYAYSNSGYTLLAAIIEKITSQAYTSYLHENIFKPQRMVATGFYNDNWEKHQVANGYFNAEDQGKPCEWPGPFWGILGNGGIMSTVEDLYRWWQALQNHKILPLAQTQNLFTRHIEEFARSYYGYGWTLQDTPFGSLITHNGGGIGGNTDFAAYTDKGLVIIIASNRIVIQIDEAGNPTEVYLPATKARTKLAYALFG
jgi:CubicO group peptidase (beta-lactamase class C family)